jgi:hypothetical protein
VSRPVEQTVPRPRTTSERDALGRARLDLGFNVAAIALIAYQLVVMMLNITAYTALPLSCVAWGILIATLVVTLIVHPRLPDDLPNWMFYSALVLWGIAAALDIAGTWGPGDDGALPTAAVAVGSMLLLCATVRSSRDIVVPSIALGVALAAAFALRGQHDASALGPAFVTIALAVAPPLLGVQIVRSLRTLVQLELDLVQVQSTVSSPRYAVGMMASEELARLDLAAERLLDGVASGRTPLPLDEATASGAASIATELRLHLIQGRRETWLYHAITESALLGPAERPRRPGRRAHPRSARRSAHRRLADDQRPGAPGRSADAESATRHRASPRGGIRRPQCGCQNTYRDHCHRSAAKRGRPRSVASYQKGGPLRRDRLGIDPAD